jgi:hypothetical protein
MEDFVGLAYIFQSGQAAYAVPKYIDPLALYLRTLKTPANPSPQAPSLVAAGSQLFQRECKVCHSGTNGESLFAVRAANIGTPEVLVDPLAGYAPPTDMAATFYERYTQTIGYPLTLGGVYSRRLRGAWSRSLLMKNGGVQGLEHAFCLNGTRGSDPRSSLTDATHLDLCTRYTEAEKRSLLAFLRSWN